MDEIKDEVIDDVTVDEAEVEDFVEAVGDSEAVTEETEESAEAGVEPVEEEAEEIEEVKEAE